jgi:glutamyl-tRNA(Gln) amidotransferase subunit E
MTPEPENPYRAGSATEINPRREPSLDFPDRPPERMTAADYETIGFMAGLEVHQQLRTRSKLFCRCPAGRYVRSYDAEVLRHMRPTLSELGEYDGTALMEFKTRKEIVYQLERGSVCTYEMDDTPPFEVDEEAIKIAIEICLLFDMNLVSELHVMRKQYLDGSIPTGFQRTIMMGLTGSIPFRVPELGVDRALTIRQLSLEEDSCREISDRGHRIVFRTDRLGMPLTEVVTEPELRTPEELRAAARLVARLTRRAGRIRRGAGAARQDVNVSVAGGRRIELKGVPSHKVLPRLVHVEAFRQLNLLRVRAELERRGIAEGDLVLPEEGDPWESAGRVIDASGALRETDFVPLRESLERGETAAALRLPGFGRILSHATQPGVTFAAELADRVRVIACLDARPFLVHCDPDGPDLGRGRWADLRRALGADRGDALVVLWGPRRDVETGVREIFIRAREALAGVPAETRQAFRDGTSGFERILPGPDRMYPDTDTPPIPIPDRWIQEIRVGLEERPWVREERYRSLGLDASSAGRLADAPWADLFDILAPAPGVPARRLASALETRLPYHRRRAGRPILPEPERLDPLVRAIESGSIRQEALEAALDRLIEEPAREAGEVLARFSAEGPVEEELERLVARAAERAHALGECPREALLRYAMGQVMPHVLGRVAPAHVRERLVEALEPAGRSS